LARKKPVVPRTRIVLNNAVRDGYVEQLFHGPRKEHEEVKAVRFNTFKFQKEFGFTLVYRDCVGYYITDINTRTVSGLHPMSYKEFVLFVLFASCVVFTDPKINLSLDFTYHLMRFYGVPLEVLDQVKEELKKYIA
jgi:hypothetical protein